MKSSSIILAIAAMLLSSCVTTPVGPIDSEDFPGRVSLILELTEPIKFTSRCGWYPRFVSIGKYDKSIYDLSDPGPVPEGVLVITESSIGFVVWRENEGQYRSLWKISADRIEKSMIVDSGMILVFWTTEKECYVMQLGGGRVDKDSTQMADGLLKEMYNKTVQ